MDQSKQVIPIINYDLYIHDLNFRESLTIRLENKVHYVMIEEIVNGYNISIFRVSKLNGGITMKFYICPELVQTVVEVVAGSTCTVNL